MRFISILGAIVFIGAGCFGGTPAPVTDGENVGGRIGQTVPNLSFETFDGEQVSLRDFEGQPIFLDFWAAWCPFCTGEMPEIEELHQELGDGVAIIGVHRTNTESVNAGRRFADNLGVTYMLVQDKGGDAYRTFTGSSAMPLGIFIDRNGVIRDVVFGPKTVEQMRAGIENLLQYE